MINIVSGERINIIRGTLNFSLMHYHFTTVAACTICFSLVLAHSASSWIRLGS